MEAIIAWIDAHPIITAVFFSIVGGQAIMPILKKITILTPSKADDLILDALEKALTKKEEISKESPEALEKVLSLEAINEIIKLRRARLARRKGNALENSTKR